jgi:hypothetical protein
MKSFNTKNTSSFFRGGKKPNKKKNSTYSSTRNSKSEIKVPPIIIDHKPKQ